MLLNCLNTNKRASDYGITAMRMELVRITSLGITGLDTPGSLNALPEAAAVLDGMKNCFSQNYKDANNEITKLFNGAISTIPAVRQAKHPKTEKKFTVHLSKR